MFNVKWIKSVSILFTVASLLTAVSGLFLFEQDSAAFVKVSLYASPYGSEQEADLDNMVPLIDSESQFEQGFDEDGAGESSNEQDPDSSDDKQKVIVGFKGEPARGNTQQTQRKQQIDLVKSFGGEVDRDFTIINALSARLPQQAIDALLKHHDIIYIEPDYTLKAVSQTVPWGINRVFGPETYSFKTWDTSRGSNISVAVLDTGVDMNHIDLPGLLGGTNTIDGTHWGSDVYGHGTHVAGIIAALDNDMGVVGAAPGAGLYSVKVMDDNGRGTTTSVVAGIEWALDNNIPIINMSLGGPNYSQALRDACDVAYTKGVLLIGAAGNDGSSTDNVLYPARFASVIAVSASDSSDKIASFSSRGPSIELIAPGASIISLWPGNYMTYCSGTSMAAPHVAGSAATLWGADTSLSNVEVRQLLRDTAQDLGLPVDHQGYGIVRADLVVLQVLPSISSNADLSVLTISEGMLNPLFESSKTDYLVNVSHDICSIILTPNLSDVNASVTINGDSAASGFPITVDLESPGMATEINIVVTAEDGVTQKTYAIIVNRADEPGLNPTRVGVHRDNTFYLDADGDLNFDSAIDRYSNFGTPDDIPVIGDWNGDGHDQIGIRRDNTFYLDYNDNMAWEFPGDIFGNFGVATDTILIGDWNGDGKDQVGVWREGTFYLDYDGNLDFDPAVDKMYSFGASDGTPIIGDWNGDGKDQIGVRHGSIFYLDYDGDGTWDPALDKMGSFGLAADTILIGDWNGDGSEQVGVHRDNTFYLDYDGDLNFNAAIDKFANFGTPDDIPIIGDWNGDGKDQIGIRRGPTFYLDYNGNMTWEYPGDIFGNFGIATDKILLGKWGPGMVEPVLEIVAEGLGLIWAIDFLPGTSKLLANENSGSIFLIDTETLEVVEIAGAPEVVSSGQGGLLDVTVSPDFEYDSFIYLTYSAANEVGESATHLARATLDLDERRLNGLEELYVAEPFQSGASHFGSRVVIQGDYLYMTIGDRGDKNFDNHVSQDTTNVLGTTIRLMRDGTIPADNPFVDDATVLDEIYTYGHRNSQGMTIHPETGEIWQSEHGEREGDEINIIYGGNNYGWPIATYSCTYDTGENIGVFPEDHDDSVNPVHYWECGSGGFPPAGMTFYDADGFVDWQGDLFVGGLAGQYLAHFRVTDGGLEELNPLLAGEGWRFRDVTVGNHDGAIYAAVEGHSVSIIRIVPRPVE